MFRGCRARQLPLLRASRAQVRPFASRAAESNRPPTEAPSSDPPKVIFSGIQPTGVPHLGNYLGALREWKRLQDTAHPDDKLIFSIVDLHAITVPRPSEELRRMRHEMLLALLAIGLDPQRCIIFFQSQVPAHAELQWILSCSASMGYLSRMTQWKSKLQVGGSDASLDDAKVKKRLKHGLFSYPILQAADILVHRATHVPVGEDQRQHLEFARECVTNFNHTYGSGTLVAPETLVSPSKRVMSLRNPTQKMSKSDPAPKSCLFLTDSPETIKERIMGAVTDSNPEVTYDWQERPGVANLVDILSSLDPQGRNPAQLAERMKGRKIRDLKELLVQVICDELAPFQERYEKLKHQRLHLVEVQRYGAKKASWSASETLALVKQAMGLNEIDE